MLRLQNLLIEESRYVDHNRLQEFIFMLYGLNEVSLRVASKLINVKNFNSIEEVLFLVVILCNGYFNTVHYTS